MSQIYHDLLTKKAQGKKSLALLLDPDKVTPTVLGELLAGFVHRSPAYLMVGGSLISSDRLGWLVGTLKAHPHTRSIPLIIFPGSYWHIHPQADGILLLSLISGRNPDYLIGNHVIAAPLLKRTSLEILPTGYILVHCGNLTTVAYMSNTQPIPYTKDDVALCTALAGEMLGLKLIYMDGGSGALQPISPTMIAQVSQHLTVPLIVGGGIRSTESLETAFKAGADLVVIGTAVEQNPSLLSELLACVEQLNATK